MEKVQQISHGDCFDVMKNIPDNSVDMVLCDLPYGKTDHLWDVKLNLQELWLQWNRVVKLNSAIVLFSAQPFTTDLIISNRKGFKYDWVWNKSNPSGFQIAKYQPLRQHESILIFTKGRAPYYPIMVERNKLKVSKNYSNSGHVGGVEYNSGKVYTYTHKYPVSILTGMFEPKKGRLHPSQKPVALCEYLIKTYTLENAVILDNCCGSGSTLVAAKNVNRQFIGIEKDEKYYNITLERLKL